MQPHTPTKLITGSGRLFSGLRDTAVSLLFPSSCKVCGEPIESWCDGIACQNCWSVAIQRIEQATASENFCQKCGQPLTVLPRRINNEQRRCGQCDDMAFSFARACGVYEGAFRESVLWLKRHPQIPARLRDQLRTAFINLNDKLTIESIIPVPLHASRLAQRGYNQAEILSNELASLTGLRVDVASLVRSRQTERHRAGMGARERSRSLEKAFRVRAPRLIQDRSVLLVDDVMTTGSTAHAIAKTLIDKGARSVSVLTLARAASEFIS